MTGGEALRTYLGENLGLRQKKALRAIRTFIWPSMPAMASSSKSAPEQDSKKRKKKNRGREMR
jgi:hypothetical protein